jgi:hypothetical protein
MTAPKHNPDRRDRREIDRRNRDLRQIILLLLQIIVDVLTLKR